MVDRFRFAADRNKASSDWSLIPFISPRNWNSTGLLFNWKKYYVWWWWLIWAISIYSYWKLLLSERGESNRESRRMAAFKNIRLFLSGWKKQETDLFSIVRATLLPKGFGSHYCTKNQCVSSLCNEGHILPVKRTWKFSAKFSKKVTGSILLFFLIPLLYTNTLILFYDFGV
jgi:hypothetical protein